MQNENEALHDDAIDDLFEEYGVELDEEAASEVNGEAAAGAVKKAIDGSAKKKQGSRKGDKLSTEDDPGVLPGAGNGSDTPGQTAKLEAYKKKMAKMEDEDEDEDDDMEESYDFSEDLDALVSSEATLSETFREKAELIFEAALNSKLDEEISRLDEQYQEAMNEELQAIEEGLVEKVDSYLNYVVENWMEENELAVESGLRADIAESFMTALQSVFTEHYVEVPEGKTDLVDDLATRIEELEESLNTVMDKNIELSEQNTKLAREAVIREQAEGLSASQVEKLIALSENVDAEDFEDFSSKVATLKESYFGVKRVIAEEAEPLEGDVERNDVSPMMEKYLAALRTNS